MNRREMLQLSAAVFAAPAGWRQLPTSPGSAPAPDEMIQRYLADHARRIDANFMDGATTREAWEAKRPEMQRQFLDMLGLDPLPERTDLKATITGTLEQGDVTIETLHFQSRPGLYVFGNLFRPSAGGTSLPAILYVCGHTPRPRDGTKTAYQDHGYWFASNGYVCLVVDTVQLGEIEGAHHGTFRLNRFWWHSRGYTSAGLECWNGIRAIDYLSTRPEVDPNRIGVTGISGGGAVSAWIAGVDDRVKVSVPVSGMSDLESYVTDRVVDRHCDCIFTHNLYQWEWTTYLAMFAPKPMLFANSDNDNYYPMDGNRRVIARLRRCYEMLGAPDLVAEHVSPGGHAYRPDLRVAIFRFFNRHLKGDAGPVIDAVDPKIPGPDLRVFPEDSDLPTDAINATADEAFVPAADVTLPADTMAFAAWKTALVTRLRERVFRALPEEVPAAREEPTPGEREPVYHVEPGIVVEPAFSRVTPGGSTNELTWIILNADEGRTDALARWQARFPDSDWLGAYTRGGGRFRWTRRNPPNTVERSLALIGQTADSGRVRDVIALVSQSRQPYARRRVCGTGPAGIIAAYAALLAPGLVHEVVIADPPASHMDGPHFLNVLRVLDIPDALGLLAPDVQLTLIGSRASDQPFDRTAAIYALAGASGAFRRG
jgi:dienelactone hydrolase